MSIRDGFGRLVNPLSLSLARGAGVVHPKTKSHAIATAAAKLSHQAKIDPSADVSDAPSGVAWVDAACQAANAVMGVPYVWGAKWPSDGSLPDGLDCSGLAEGCYRMAGRHLPAGSVNQREATVDVPLDELQPGDLVFKRTADTGKVHHVGLYVGDGNIIEAPNTGAVVKKSTLTHWQSSGDVIEGGRLA